MKKLNYRIFYLAFYILNLFNSYILIYGLLHKNISGPSFEIKTFLLSLIGNSGAMLFSYALSIIFFKKRKSKINFLLFVSFVMMIICAGTAVFANIFSLFFSFKQLTTFGNPSEMQFVWFYLSYGLSMLSKLSQFVELIPFVILVVIRIFTDDSSNYIHSPIYKLSILFSSFVFMIFPIINLTKSVDNTIYENCITPSIGASKVGLYDYYLYDLYDYLFDKDNDITQNEIEEIEEYLYYYKQPTYVNELNNKTYSVINEYTNLANGKNLIVIQLEAFNSFLVNLKIDGEEITPNLNKLVNKSIYFDNFYSTAGIGNTSETEFSLFTGLYGTGKDLAVFEYMDNEYEALGKCFSDNGYYTYTTHGNVGDFYLRNKVHIDKYKMSTHFDIESYKQFSVDDLPLIYGYLDDRFFMKHIIDFAPSEKFFSFAITVTSHSPYIPDKNIPKHEYKGITKLAKQYFDCCRLADEGIGIFIDSLEEKGILDDTVIVMYGDHTSSLFEEDLESIFDRELNAIEMREYLQKTPCLIYNESLFAPRVINKVVGTTCISRTLANLFGLNQTYHFGVDMLTDEPALIYSPRNLDIHIDGLTIAYPSLKTFGNDTSKEEMNKYVLLFEKYKRINDMLLTKNYFAQ